MRGTLDEWEPHPAARNALGFITRIPREDLMQTMEAFASTAISGNRTSEICAETLRRILRGRPISDRYVLGLAWVMREIYPDKTL